MLDKEGERGVLFLHGLESGPHGAKSRCLSARFPSTSVAPDMQMGTYTLNKTNSFARSLVWAGLTRPWLLLDRRTLMHAAVLASLDQCVAIAAANTTGTLLVGSSWGGAVALRMLASGLWTGDALLLAPALKKVLSLSGAVEGEEVLAQTYRDIRARAMGSRILVIHGDADDVVPLADSEELCRATGAELRVLAGADHGMNDALVTQGLLIDFIEKRFGFE